MDNIVKKRGYNVQGVRDILFNDIENITSIPGIDNTSSMIDISAMVLVAEFNNAGFTQFSAKFTEVPIDKNGVEWFRQTLTFFAAQDTVQRWIGFNDMQYHEFLVAIRDNNNRSRFCGYINLQGEKRGMTFSAALSTEKVNGHDCIFTMEAPYRAIHCVLVGEVGLQSDPLPPDDGDMVSIGGDA